MAADTECDLWDVEINQEKSSVTHDVMSFRCDFVLMVSACEATSQPAVRVESPESGIKRKDQGSGVQSPFPPFTLSRLSTQYHKLHQQMGEDHRSPFKREERLQYMTELWDVDRAESYQ